MSLSGKDFHLKKSVVDYTQYCTTLSTFISFSRAKKSDITFFTHRLKLPRENPGDPAVNEDDGLGLALDERDDRRSDGEEKNPIRLGGNRRRAPVARQQPYFPEKGILFGV